jgi:hypothetical protein
VTEAEFQKQMNRLAETFGAASYKGDRVTMLWRRVKDFSSHWLERTVDGFVLGSRQAPLPADFEEAISLERERVWKAKKSDGLHEVRASYSCGVCKDTGVYVCSHPHKGGMWGFRCHCERGIADAREAIPFYTETHQQEGYVFREMPVYRGTA